MTATGDPPYSASLPVHPGSIANQTAPVAASTSEGSVIVAYLDDAPGSRLVHVVRSDATGLGFTPPVRVDRSLRVPANQQSPALVPDTQGRLLLVWSDDRVGSGDVDVYLAASTDRGSTWTLPMRADDGPAGTRATRPTVAAYAGRVWVAWQDTRGGPDRIRFATALWPDLRFSPSKAVSDGLPASTAQSGPRLAVDGAGLLFLGFHDNRTGDANTYLLRSSDDGSTFTGPVRIDDTGSAMTAQGLPSIAVDGAGRVFAAWQDRRNGDEDIYASVSSDRGLTFARSVRVDGARSGTSQVNPQIAVGQEGFAYLGWQDDRTGSWDIWATASFDGGRTFSTAAKADDGSDTATNPTWQTFPAVAVLRAGAPLVTWQDDRTYNPDVRAAVGGLAPPPSVFVRIADNPLRALPGSVAVASISVAAATAPVPGATVRIVLETGQTFTGVDEGGGSYAVSIPTPASSVPLRIAGEVQVSKAGYVGSTQRFRLIVEAAALDVVVSADPGRVSAGTSAGIIARVTRAGVAVAGAAVALSASAGILTPSSGSTDSDGNFRAQLSTSGIGTQTSVQISASARGVDGGMGSGSASLEVVIPDGTVLQIAFDRLSYATHGWEPIPIGFRVEVRGALIAGAVVRTWLRGTGWLSVLTDAGNGTYVVYLTAPESTTTTRADVYLDVAAEGYLPAAAIASVTILEGTVPTALPVVGIEAPLPRQYVDDLETVVGLARSTSRPLELVEVRVDGGPWLNVRGLYRWLIPYDFAATPPGIHVIYARSFDGVAYSPIAYVVVRIAP